MAETLWVQSGGLDLTIPESQHDHHDRTLDAAPTPPPSRKFALDEAPTRLPWTASLVFVVLCELAMLTTVRNGWASTDDGAGVVPLIALAGIGLAAVRWRPDAHSPPARGVSTRLAVVVFLTSVAMTTAILTGVISSSDAERWLGPIVSLAIVATYMATWGFRSLALLRLMVLLSLLTWQPIAGAVHDIVRSTLDQPSELIYQRLGRLPWFGVDEEPWRLLTASLHRGSVVLIATVALALAASRTRVTLRSAIDLLLTVTVAVVVHHAVVLASSIDQYDPADVTQVATNPTLEIGISIIAVVCLGLARARRHRRREHDDHRPPAAAPTNATQDRDPVIFAALRTRPHPLVFAMLFTGVAPLTVLALGL